MVDHDNEALDKMKQQKAAEVAKHTQNFTHELLTMKKSAEPLQARTILMHTAKKTGRYTRLNICTRHHIIPKELKATLVCHHCQCKGHYARNCCTRRKELKATPPTTIRTAIITDNNRYKELTKEKLEESGCTTEDPLSSPSLLFHTNSLRHPVLGNGLDLVSPPSHPQGPKCLGATEIQKLIQLNVTQYSQTKHAEFALSICDQLKKLP
jgi:hypothetical protein